MCVRSAYRFVPVSCISLQLAATIVRGSCTTFNPKVTGSIPARPIESEKVNNTARVLASYDLLGSLPDLGEVLDGGRRGVEIAWGLPDDHRLVYATPVEVCPDRPFKLVHERMHLVGFPRPVRARVVRRAPEV